MTGRVASRLRGALPWAVPLVVLLSWQASSDLGWIDPDVLPSPVAVAHAGWLSLRSGELLRNV